MIVQLCTNQSEWLQMLKKKTEFFIHMTYCCNFLQDLTVDNVDTSIMQLQQTISAISAAEEQSTVNLDTISIIFNMIADNSLVNRNVFESAAMIVGYIQQWDEKNLRNLSAQ